MRFFLMLAALATGCESGSLPVTKNTEDSFYEQGSPVKIVAKDRADQINRLRKWLKTKGTGAEGFFDKSPKTGQFGRFTTVGLTPVQIISENSFIAEYSFLTQKKSGVWDGKSAKVEFEKSYAVIADFKTKNIRSGVPLFETAFYQIFEVVGFHNQKMSDGTTRKLPQLQPVPQSVVEAAKQD